MQRGLRLAARRAARSLAAVRRHSDPAPPADTTVTAAAPDVLITGGTLIDGTGAPPRPLGAMLLRGDCIAAVGEHAVAQAGADCRRIDAEGQTVMPGLIDVHCHVTFGEPQSNDELFFHRREGLSAIVAAWQMQKLLRAGVTGFLDADVMYNLGADLRDAIDCGVVDGPRMATGGRALLTAVGGTSGIITPDSGSRGYAQICNSKDEIVSTVRRQIRNGVDYIKVHVTGLVPRSRTPGEQQVWSYEEIKLVCDTAHDLGIPVVVHCRNASSTRDAARAGVDLILHATHMDEEALEEVIKRKVPLAPTLTFQANLADFGHKIGTSPELIEVFRREIEDSSKTLAMAFKAGVPFMTGSESGFSITPYGHWHGRELRIFVEHIGMTPLEAIRCGTLEGAKAIGLEGRVGEIKEGLLADVLVVNGDPIKDIGILNDKNKLSAVISRGKPVDLSRPWPQRRLYKDEKVGVWSKNNLTYEFAHGL
eukprot:TRINITY_DN17038_c0_g1_i1.p2 TRINITY_DN17038_c0_g1~~TRINITY_DN17038_c0_g1_i1.p2  ORF type:complete len:502 (+),score=184.44 TRINITY_DN17038_c0_g1_i1:72-1508(+)